MPEVDVTIRVRRTVMKYVGLASGAGLADTAIDVGFVPVFEQPGLQLAQIRFHGEVGFGQMDGLFKVQWLICVGHCGNSYHANRSVNEAQTVQNQ